MWDLVPLEKKGKNMWDLVLLGKNKEQTCGIWSYWEKIRNKHVGFGPVGKK